MTITLLCCYHCRDFMPDIKASSSCKQGKVVCYNALMSVTHPEQEKFRDNCNRRNGECSERFDSGEAKIVHSCFVNKGSK